VGILPGTGQRLVVHPNQHHVAGRLVAPGQLPEPPVEEDPFQRIDGPAQHRTDTGLRDLLVTDAGAGNGPRADDGADCAAEHGSLEEAEAEHAQEAAPGGRNSR
jgi:hypothetical protein